MDTEGQMKAAAAAEAGDARPGSSGGGGEPEEMVPAGVHADTLKQMEEMVSWRGKGTRC